MNELDLLNEIKDLEKIICNKGFTSRDLETSDWDVLVAWWTWWRWAIMPKDFLPDNGTGGIMIEKNGERVAAGFLYKTNSNVIILEWIVSNPNYKSKDRKLAIELLITEAENKTKQLGCKYMFSVCKNKHLIDTHKKLGWIVDSKPSYEITKKL